MVVDAISSGLFDAFGLRDRLDQVVAARFARADADGSGGLNRAEYGRLAPNANATAVDEAFAALDRDDSGAISEPEFEAAGRAGLSGTLSPDMVSVLLLAQEEARQTGLTGVLSDAITPREEDSTPIDTEGLLATGAGLGATGRGEAGTGAPEPTIAAPDPETDPFAALTATLVDTAEDDETLTAETLGTESEGA
ncbi:hypothetical protein [Roseospira marina]|nr:hypothetical protein [Roseospira marina]MBB4314718.1 hypothetical protein [Roseospira marina]MBB5087707.1 hypothetical protein [Roseospira marina]